MGRLIFRAHALAFLCAIALVACSSNVVKSNSEVRNLVVGELDSKHQFQPFDCNTSIFVRSALDSADSDPWGCWAFESSGTVDLDVATVEQILNEFKFIQETRLYCATTNIIVPLSVCSSFSDIQGGEGALLRFRFVPLDSSEFLGSNSESYAAIVVTASVREVEMRWADDPVFVRKF